MSKENRFDAKLSDKGAIILENLAKSEDLSKTAIVENLLRKAAERNLDMPSIDYEVANRKVDESDETEKMEGSIQDRLEKTETALLSVLEEIGIDDQELYIMASGYSARSSLKRYPELRRVLNNFEVMKPRMAPTLRESITPTAAVTLPRRLAHNILTLLHPDCLILEEFCPEFSIDPNAVSPKLNKTDEEESDDSEEN